MPDIIFYDQQERSNFHRGISSHQILLRRIVKCTEITMSFVEAGTEAALLPHLILQPKCWKHYKEVAWYTEFQLSDELTHLLHKNGDKFVGRPL